MLIVITGQNTNQLCYPKDPTSCLNNKWYTTCGVDSIALSTSWLQYTVVNFDMASCARVSWPKANVLNRGSKMMTKASASFAHAAVVL